MKFVLEGDFFDGFENYQTVTQTLEADSLEAATEIAKQVKADWQRDEAGLDGDMRLYTLDEWFNGNKIDQQMEENDESNTD